MGSRPHCGAASGAIWGAVAGGTSAERGRRRWHFQLAARPATSALPGSLLIQVRSGSWCPPGVAGGGRSGGPLRVPLLNGRGSCCSVTGRSLHRTHPASSRRIVRLSAWLKRPDLAEFRVLAARRHPPAESRSDRLATLALLERRGQAALARTGTALTPRATTRGGICRRPRRGSRSALVERPPRDPELHHRIGQARPSHTASL